MTAPTVRRGRDLDLHADALERLGQGGELSQGGFEVLDDLGCDHTGCRQVVGVLQALVAEPEDVEARLVAGDQLVVAEPVEPLALLSLASLPGLVALDEVVEVGAGEGVGLEREVLVRPQVVDPQILRPRGV